MSSPLFLPAKKRGFKPTLENVQVPLAFQRDDLPRFFVDKSPSHSAKPALEAHVRAAAQAEQRLVNIGDLQVDVPRFFCAVGPHDASTFPEIRDRVAIGDLVLHALHGLQ